MDFEKREAHWKEYLDLKNSFISSFHEDKECKVCMCLELLKIVTCPGQCVSSDWDRLFERLVEGVLDEETVEMVKEHFSDHSDSIQTAWSFQSDLRVLAKQVQSFIPENNLVERLEMLENRIVTYEENMEHLKEENERLRHKLKCYEQNVQDIKQEHCKIKESIEETERISDKEIKLLTKEKSEWMKDQENNINQLKRQVDQIKNYESECSSALETSEIIKEEFRAMQSWLSEVRVASKHTGHLLTAADSISNSHKQFLKNQETIKILLEGLQNNTQGQENAKEAIDVANLDYAVHVNGLRRQMSELQSNWFHNDKYHPGVLGLYNGVQVWNCCKGTKEAKGCKFR